MDAHHLTPQEISRRASGRSTWHRKASRPVSLWMFALLVTVFLHRWVPEPIWVMVHIVTVGMVSNSILIWSQHFTEALLKHRVDESFRKGQLARIYSLNAGFLLLIIGVTSSTYLFTLIGATGIGAAATWHALSLLTQYKKALPSRFGMTVRYYITASFLLPVGAILGAVLAHRGLSAGARTGVLLAHEAINILGFVGITAVGTLITFWPTMLRTPMHPKALTVSTRSLAMMGAGLAITAVSALASWPYPAALGTLIYAAAIIYIISLMLRTCTLKKPVDYPTASVLASLVWLTVTVLYATYLLATRDFSEINLRQLTPIFTAGFLLQLLLGAMSYLLPVRMGGGPAAVRAANREFNRFALGRVAIINLSLLVFTLPAHWTGSWVRTLVSILGALTFAAFLPLMFRGVKKSVAARQEMIAARARGERPSPTAHPEGIRPEAPNVRRQLLLGTLTVAGATALGAGINRALNGLSLIHI